MRQTLTALPSERVVIAAPLSFTGSAQRLWRLTHTGRDGWQQALIMTGVALLIVVSWSLIGTWYLTFGLWLVPYRLIRRGQRRREREQLQHRETLAAIEGRR